MRKFIPVAAIVFAITFAFADAKAACGTAEVVKGDAQVTRAGESTAVPLKATDKVCAGDQVTTAKDARVKLAMEDGNILNINPASAIKIEAYENNPDTQKKKVLLNVMYGKMRATVKQKYTGASNSGEPQTFQVKTKSAVAGVRGTDFLTSFDKGSGKMGVVTFEGRVEVGKMGPDGSITNSVFVNPGFSTEAGKSSAPSAPAEVPKAELQKIESGSQASAPIGGASGSSSSTVSDGKDEKGPKSGERAPASSAPSENLAALPPPPPPPSVMPTTPGLPLLPQTPNIPQIPKCDFCDKAIQSGPGKLNIEVCIKGSSKCP